MEVSKIHGSFSPTSARGMKPWELGVDYALDESLPTTLKALGIGFEPGVFDDMMSAARRYGSDFGIAMDTNNIQQPLTASSLAVPLQFLQNWLPGFVGMTTVPRSEE